MKYTKRKLVLALTAGTLALVSAALLVAGETELALALSTLSTSLVLWL